MKVVDIAIGEIRPYDNNPRRNDQAVDAVARSLSEFGWQQPIVVDADNTIIVGHTRYKAALSLGMKNVPVVVADKLTPEQARAYRIADNKTGELAEFDDELLSGEIQALMDDDYDLTVLCFDDSELAKIVDAPDFDPVPMDSQTRLDDGVKKVCPSCGYEWV